MKISIKKATDREMILCV